MLNIISKKALTQLDNNSYYTFFGFWSYWFSFGYFALKNIIYGTPKLV